ncbi:MAG: M56 family metallopeptidase [Winogradskyella sp.]|nr:MAG: M56 family metallopeptidase [Winogradskyella sp.]
MAIYLLKSTAILAIFWTLYVLLLEREKMHRFKRFYLLASVASAITIPLLSIKEYVYTQPIDGNIFNNEIVPFEILEPLELVEVPFWNLESILWLIYGIGVFIFSIRFIKNLDQIFKTIRANEKQKKASITFVLLKQLINPHTFFNYIFLNKKKFENKALPKEVILHEETHAKQKHSLDILFIEFLQIVLWFQPFVWLYKKRIKLNHEFLADQAVLNQGYKPANYQNTLLSYSSNDEDFILANAINYSSIKKRFTVMKTQTSKSKIWLLGLLTLPVLAILFYSFSDREIIEIEDLQQENLSAQLSTQNSIPTNKNKEASQALMKEYKSFIEKYNEAKIIYGDAYERAIIIYDQLMSDTQRASVEKYPARIIPPMPNLSKTKAKAPTNTEFEAFKNAEKYAIWIDGKHVPNAELKKYITKDFVHVSGSRVFKNARSKKFPQPNQYHLYTKAGFKSTYQDSQIKRYNKATKKYSNAIKDYLKGSQTDNSELIILKTKADEIYKTFSSNEIKANNIKTASPIPAKKSSNTARSISIKVFNDGNYEVDGIKTNKKSFVSTVNQLHQDISSEIRNKIINIHLTFTGKESNEEVWFIYNSLLDYGFHRLVTKNQEVIRSKGNTPFADNANNQKQQNPATAKEIAEYNTWAKKMKAKFLKMPESEKVEGYPHMINDEIFRYHNSIYDRMSKAQKENTESLPEAVLVTEWPMPTAVVVNKITDQQKTPTAKEVAEYNAWAKKLSNQISKAKSNKNADYPIIKQKDIEKYKSIYSRMTEKQKTNAEVFPNIPPPPPPPPTKVKQYKNGKKKTLNEIIKNTRKGAKSGYEVLDNGESHYYIVYKGKKTYYNKDGYITDDKGNVLPPPPPPPPAPKKSKSKGGPNADDIKLVFTDKAPETKIKSGSIDYQTRQLILKVSKSQTKSVTYKLNNTSSNSSEIEKYLETHQEANVTFEEGKNNVLSFSDKKGAKMSTQDLQSIYSNLFKTYSKKNKNILLYSKTDNNPVKEYKEKYIAYKKLLDIPPHYIYKTDSEKEKMEALFSELGSMYFRLSKKNKKMVDRPIAPIRPYIKITLNGKSYYKKSNELTEEERATLPPPPPPPTKKHN